MTEEMKIEATPVECREKDESVTPVGDFIAQVAAAAAVIFAFLTFYTDPLTGKAVKGYETAYGIIIIIVAALAFGLATAVLWTKFLKQGFWFRRSPGWAYGSAAAIIIIVTILAMVFPESGHDVSWGALIVELFAGAFIAIASMLKF
jgi:uncharacterized membrane protein YidH (DUF202 family)